MVYVTLFPTQTETDGLFVIVLAATGVTYSNQCGGTACDQKNSEGYLVPVGTTSDLATIKHWFLKRYGESCWCDGRIAADPALVRELADLLASLPCWLGDSPEHLSLDVDRLDGGGEACSEVAVWGGVAHLDQQRLDAAAS